MPGSVASGTPYISRLLIYSSRNVYGNDAEINGNNYFLARLLMPCYILKGNLKCAITRHFNSLWKLKVCYKIDAIKHLKSALPSTLLESTAWYMKKLIRRGFEILHRRISDIFNLNYDKK